MKSIRAKITLCMIMTVLVALAAVGVVSIKLNYDSTLDTVELMMGESATLASQRVQQEITAYINVAMDTGCIPQLSDESASVEEKQSIISQRVSMHNFQRGNIIGPDGVSIFDGKDYNDREYVQKAMAGNVYVSEPLISKITGEFSIMVAAPIWKDGIPDSTVVGVVYFVPQETFLNDIVSSIHVSENGKAYMINKNGDTIADRTLDTIMSQNIESEAQGNSALKNLAGFHAMMRQGQEGFGSYETSQDEQYFIAYAPVENTDGWSIAITAPHMDYLSSTYSSSYITIILLAAFLVISCVIAMVLSISISNPMKACAERMQRLVKGDLDSPVPDVRTKDETGMLAAATGEMIEGLRAIIGDADYLLKEMAGLNLDIHTQNESAYVGGFQSILLSIRQLRNDLSDILRQINQSADQVSGGSDQVSSGAQSLSQGATEQASAVEELAASITEISHQVKENAASAVEAKNQTNYMGEQVDLCSQKMQELTRAMSEIQHSSDEIGKIIKTIEDIAFQTNILALNAAVEAARVGEAGKGFAVVADEVRSLAGKSAEASKNTSALIAHSIETVHKGTEFANHTSAALQEVVSSMGTMLNSIDQIATASHDQSDAVAQVSVGIDQIASVVQTTSATAEESAATSQQLSAEAQSLKQLVGKFTLA